MGQGDPRRSRNLLILIGDGLLSAVPAIAYESHGLEIAIGLVGHGASNAHCPAA